MFGKIVEIYWFKQKRFIFILGYPGASANFTSILISHHGAVEWIGNATSESS